MKLLLITLIFGTVYCQLYPEDAAVIEVVEGSSNGSQGFYIKVNGIHRDSGDEVYMQVNLFVEISEGNVLVNDRVLPFSELTAFHIQAQLGQIVEDGTVSDFQDATVKVLFFLHEQLENEGDAVARAFRLETQVVETDEYDIHMFNVTEMVIELDSSHTEIKQTVALISETTSRLHAAKNCAMVKCKAVLGCAAWKKDANGCQTCQCAAMGKSPYPYVAHHPECLSSCDGVCDVDGVVDGATRDERGCWLCPCMIIDRMPPPTPTSCWFDTMSVLDKLNEMPLPIKVFIIALPILLSLIFVYFCCCMRPRRKSSAMKSENLKAYAIGKLQFYVPDTEKKQPLIDNLDVVSADIA